MLSYLLVYLGIGVLAHCVRADAGYVDPESVGGSMLTVVNNTYPPGLGEPLNVIISTQSDPEILIDSLYNGSFQNYMLSASLSAECLGGGGPGFQGSIQGADLDGKGNVTQTNMLRWNFGDPWVGTCKETFEGGLHFRYWKQTSTGAMFLAASVEMDLKRQHDIVPNGYNLGRDFLVGNLTNTELTTRNLTNQTVVSGTTKYRNYTYTTEARFVSGLLKNASDGINHYITVEEEGHPAIDGLVAVLTVKITERPNSAAVQLALPFFMLLAGLGGVLLA